MGITWGKQKNQTMSPLHAQQYICSYTRVLLFLTKNRYIIYFQTQSLN